MRAAWPREAGPQDELASPVQTVLALRRALRDGDATAVRRSVLWEARPPWERDLLIDLIAAEGIDVAVAKLRRFWRNARVRVTGVRMTQEGDAEVYEEVDAARADGVLHTVTLLRRVGHGFRVVNTSDAPEDTVRLFIVRAPTARGLDEVAFTRDVQVRFGRIAELVMDHGEGALGHPEEGWLARVLGPRPLSGIRPPIADLPRAQPPSTEAWELVLGPRASRERRGKQLAWLGRVAAELAAFDGAPWIYMPAAEKLTSTRMLRTAVGTHGPAGRAIAASWVRLVTKRGWATTRGMCQLQLPEVEIQLSDWSDVDGARRLVGTVAMGLVNGQLDATTHAVVRVAGLRCRLTEGRRGPEPGRSYGRWGATLLVPADRRGTVSRSETRLRLDL